MALTGRYIKYTPEITLEIFRQIWERCLSLGLKCWGGRATYQSEYNHFVGPYDIFRLNGEGLFGTYDTSGELTEISVQDFLGYDPFVKLGTFILPKQWVIKVTEENLSTLQKSDKLNKEIGYPYSIGGYYGNTTYGDTLVPKDCIEITFEQFKEYVLKEEPKPIEKWSIGSYVIFLKNIDRIGKQGFIDIINGSFDNPFTHLDKYGSLHTVHRLANGEVKWFPTLKEAEAYRDVLLSPKSVTPITKGPDFIVGKWYKNPHWCNPSRDFVKCSSPNKTGDNSINFSEKIDNGKFYNNDGDWYNSNHCVEATLEEIQQYLPDDHVDKFKTHVLDKLSEITPPIQLDPVHEETGEFKVGDWVKITKSDQNWEDSMDKYVGMVVQLSSLGATGTKYTFFHIKEDEGHWCWCYEQGHFKRVDIQTLPVTGLDDSCISISYNETIEKNPCKEVYIRELYKEEEQLPKIKRIKVELI